MKKIIIIGGGISGLTAGIYAQQHGFESIIYEKHTVIGGQCTGWVREGCYIDGCIHWLTGTRKDHSLYPIWENIGALGENVPIYNPESFGEYHYLNRKITLWTNLDKLEEELLRISPNDSKRIKKMIKQLRVFERVTIPANKPIDMMNIFDLIKVAYRFKTIFRTMNKMAKIDAGEYSKSFEDPCIKFMLTKVLRENYSMKAVMTSIATVASKNGGIPIGGSFGLAHRVDKRYKELGGKVFLGTPVDEIIIENGKAIGVRLASGECQYADYVITALDLHYVLKNLLKDQYSMKNYEERYKDSKKYPSPSNLMIAFKCDYDAKEIPFSTYFTGEKMMINNKEYNDFNLRNFNYDKEITKKDVVLASYVFTSDDDYGYWKGLDKESYNKEKNRVGKEIYERVIKKFPQLEGHIKIIDVWTPITMNGYVNARNGSYMSFIMTAKSKMLMSKNIIKEVDNLIFAGQWMMMPGGLPCALLEGKFAIQRICKFEKTKFRLT